MSPQVTRGAWTAVLLAIPALLASVAATHGAGGAGARQPTPLIGIDVSRFQGTIHWERVAADGVSFAFVQASRGSGADCAVVPERCGADEYYLANVAGARAAGIRVGAYHRAFAGGERRRDVKADARREAALFIAQVGGLEPLDLLPALDVEKPFGGLAPRQLRLWIRTWLRKVRLAFGVRPIIYTNASSWRATGDTARFARAGHALWVANWNVPEPEVPARDWFGYGWSVWQYTSAGQVAGIRGRVDMNRLSVVIDELGVGS